MRFDDFAFESDYETVKRCALALKNYGLLPCAGGVLDQPAALWDDINQWLALYYERIEDQRNE
jgi:hypothetical protein